MVAFIDHNGKIDEHVKEYFNDKFEAQTFAFVAAFLEHSTKDFGVAHSKDGNVVNYQRLQKG